MSNPIPYRRQPDSLADVLERVLDKGVVIAGDIVVNVLDIELLSLKLRLFVSSAQTAQEMGMDWWTRDPFFNSRAAAELDDDGERQALSRENELLRARIEELGGSVPAIENRATGAQSARSAEPTEHRAGADRGADR